MTTTLKVSLNIFKMQNLYVMESQIGIYLLFYIWSKVNLFLSLHYGISDVRFCSNILVTHWSHEMRVYKSIFVILSRFHTQIMQVPNLIMKTHI